MEFKNNPFQLAAESLKDIAFMKYSFPLLAIIGGGVFFYFGIKGIVKQSTISLSARAGGGYHPYPINGKAAIFVGIIYLLVGVVLTGVLGSTSFYMFFG